MQPTKGPHTEENKARSIGKACHIHAAAEGGPRFDKTQTPEQRRDAANGIWLCSNHAAEVDVDEVRFPAELLKAWKAQAERAADLRMAQPIVTRSAAGLLAAASELLGHPQSLPDGTWLTRPEMDRVREFLQQTNSGVLALLGAPGSGKSAFLARLGCDLRSEGWNVVAIKADRLPRSVATASDLQHYFNLELPVSQATYALSRNAKTVLLVDQLDALADLADAKTERLAVVLSLISSVKASGIPVVCSVREFDFKHDIRFLALDAGDVRLAPLAASDVEAVLVSRGIDTARVGQKLKSLLAIPHWLKQFVQLTWFGSSPVPETSQALLGVVWEQTVLRQPADAAENDAVASRIAEMIADREELWIPRAELTSDEVVVQRLLALGILVPDPARLRISFAHQTLYEFARARAFVRSKRLSDYVSEHQDSLFVRPTIWAALHYLRAVASNRYREELSTLWNTVRRSHLQMLLMEFVGQTDPPDDFELALLQPRFFDSRWDVVAFNAASRSAGWLRHLRSGVLPRCMVGDRPNTTYAAMTASLKLAPDETLTLMARCWGGSAEHAELVVGALRGLDDWTEQARDLLDAALRHVAHAEQVLDSFAWQLKSKAPGYAIELIARFLERNFRNKEGTLPHSVPPSPDAPEGDWLRWYVDREPEKTIREIFQSASSVHVLVDLAEAEPETFLRAFLPWVTSVLCHAAETDEWHPAYRTDHICDCSHRVGPSRELPQALRAASEKLAVADAAKFLALCSEWANSELQTIHVILSYGYERLEQTHSRNVAAYLLADPRRLKLGEAGDPDARSIALLQSIRETVSADEAAALETAIHASEPSSQSLARPVTARRAARIINREHRLRLLQALPPAMLNDQTRSQIEQETRVFGGNGRVRGLTEIRRIGSPMSAEQMAAAEDDHVLQLFQELPDSTGFQHPKRIMDGGAIEAGRELAALAKKQPERAAALIERLAPERNEIPVALAISALSESNMPTSDLCELVSRCDARGFSSVDFRDDAARALARRAGKGEALRPSVLDMFRRWLAEVPVGARTKPQLTSEENRGSPPFLLGAGGLFALPAGNFNVLDALLVALLSAKPPKAAEWMSVLQEHIKRDEDPMVWRAFAHRLEHLGRCDKISASEFVAELFLRYPEALECRSGIILLAWAGWWADPLVVKTWLDLLAQSAWEHAAEAIGELTALFAIRRQPLPWAEHELRQIIALPRNHSQLMGAAELTADLWQDPARRALACPHLCALVRIGDPAIDQVVLKRLAHDDVGADDLASEVLQAFVARNEPVPTDCSGDLISWLSTLVNAEPASVHHLLTSLISAIAKDPDATRIGFAAGELVNTALTLQRMPSFREQGLDLFEQLLRLDMYGARGALEEIDSARR